MKLRLAVPLLLSPFAMDLSAAPAPGPGVAHAGHVRLAREASFTVARPLAESFTFFEPLGEKRWAEDWQPVFASLADSPLHVGTVFTVERPSADGRDRLVSVWTITRYDPPHAVEYFNVLAGLRATRIAVHCAAAASDRTRVTVRYTYTGLTAAGDTAIQAMTEPAFAAMMADWSQAISRYLARGTPASP